MEHEDLTRICQLGENVGFNVCVREDNKLAEDTLKAFAALADRLHQQGIKLTARRLNGPAATYSSISFAQGDEWLVDILVPEEPDKESEDEDD